MTSDVRDAVGPPVIPTIDRTTPIAAGTMNNAASAIIREGATQKLQDVLVSGKGEGMQFMDDAIWQVMQQGIVSPLEAYMKAIDKNRFRVFLPPEDEGL